jgi:hypothetical protein
MVLVAFLRTTIFAESAAFLPLLLQFGGMLRAAFDEGRNRDAARSKAQER